MKLKSASAFAAVVACVASLAFASTSASAEVLDAPAPQTVVNEYDANFEITADLEFYLNTLPQSERVAFVNTMLPNTTVETTTVTPANAAAKASLEAAEATGDVVTPFATGCWTARTDWEQKNVYGGGIYSWYHVGRWCANGSTVTSASRADYGGQTYAIGWRKEGLTASAAGVVSNQGRSYTQQKFVLGVGGWDVDTRYECARVAGKSNATATGTMTCGIY